jgi:hypothetical protein
MLNKLAQLLSQAMFLTYDRAQGRDIALERKGVLRRAQFMVFIWLLYFIGAGTGVWMDSIWGIRSLVLPAGVVVLGIAMDQRAPLSLEEEKDEA